MIPQPTSPSIDTNLIDEVRNGRAVLFLGAGASLGAKDERQNLIPDTGKLAGLIQREFLGGLRPKFNFVNTCDYAATARNGRELQKYIRDVLSPFEPADYHKKIPTFHWAGLATTNFDLIVERAYRDATSPLQRLRPLVQDTPEFMDTMERGDVLFLKLHGCITTYEQVSPGMVFSTERILRHMEGRAGQFKELFEWAQQKTLIFAGYSLQDHDLRLLLDEIVKEGDNRPRHYIVQKDVESFEVQYWSERRFTLIDSTFEDFIKDLDNSISVNLRGLSVVRSSDATPLTKYIASNRRPSSALANYLATGAEHVSTETLPSSGSAHKFFNGFDLGWYPIEHGIDIERPLTRTLLEERVAVTGIVTAPQLIVLKGHAGSGKSVALRRIAWDAAKRLSKLVVYVPASGYINTQAIQELLALAKEPLFLVIEDLTLISSSVMDLMNAARRERSPLVVIGGARPSEWNIRAQFLESVVTAEYELKYLSRRETDDLISQLDLNDCLGELKHLTHEQRVKQFNEIYGRQLLVALHEATRNAHFRDIIHDEYTKISPPEAQLLYADICALHRFGSPVRAGLISRVHGISFEQFQERFFMPLEQVVSLEKDERSGDWIYRARHPLIAEMLYEQVFPTPAEKFDNIAKFITRLNPTYSYDRRIIGELLRGNRLAEALPVASKGQAIFDLALQALGDEPHIYHQKGIYFMRLALAGDSEALREAEEALQEANRLAPTDRTIKHSLAELALTRSRLSEDSIERAAWRNEAIAKSRPLVASTTSSHAYHTIAKAQLQALGDALDVQAEGDETLSADVVSEAIKAVEETLRAGLQRYPGDSHLLAEEAGLARLLRNDERAERALKRAFEANRRSQLIAKRYAVVLKARDKLADAREVLRQALEYHSASHDLNYDFAELLRAIDPAIDVKEPDVLLSYYGRAFSKGDKNYRSQFLYARQLILAGRPQDARPVFDHLKQSPIPFPIKNQVKEVVRLETGEIRRYNGTVTGRRDSYGFVRLDNDGIDCYFDSQSVRQGEDLPGIGARVELSLGFNFHGPAACDMATIK